MVIIVTIWALLYKLGKCFSNCFHIKDPKTNANSTTELIYRAVKFS